MGKLSDTIRLKAYESVLMQLKELAHNPFFFSEMTIPPYHGLCIYLYTELQRMGIQLGNWIKVAAYFPEFLQCKPAPVVPVNWWEKGEAGFTIRVAVLQWCIEQIKKTRNEKVETHP